MTQPDAEQSKDERKRARGRAIDVILADELTEILRREADNREAEVAQQQADRSAADALEGALLLLLKENLSIEVSGGDFTSPNDRNIVVRFGTTVITSARFDVVQMREYEG